VEQYKLNRAARIEALKRAPIFAALDEDDLSLLADISTGKNLGHGEHLFWEGDVAPGFYVIAVGRIKVSKASPSGKEFVVAVFGPGDILGEVAAFEGKPYPASAQATEPSALLRINTVDFSGFLARHPEVALKIINMLGGRLREAMARLRDLAGERVEQRIAGILVMLSAKFGPNLPFTRQEIADMSGTTIETAIRIVARLKQGGMLKTGRGKLTITDEKRLRLLSQGPPAA
jgi:CRP/FNR family transcriptional regulator, nitrogen oxide reductase regulator